MRPSSIEISHLEFAWEKSGARLSVGALSIAAGERAFLSGANGSGKSTLLALIGGLLIADSGSLRVAGTEMRALKAAERDKFRGDHIGHIFQMFNLVPYLSVFANIALPLHFSALRRERLKGAEPRREAARLLDAMALGGRDILDRPVLELSIGQQQRVAAARALIGRPDILMADEPTSALDGESRASFLRLLLEECRAAGSTLLFVSHDASLAAFFDRALTMGEIARVRRSIN